jgi:hypothetical protein
MVIRINGDQMAQISKWQPLLTLLSGLALVMIFTCILGGIWLEERILPRQDHTPHPELNITVPCEYKGKTFYCTPNEALFLKTINMTIVLAVVGGISAAVISRIQKKPPSPPVP